MTLDQLNAYAFPIIKVLSLIGLLVYAAFAGILVRQEQLMAHVLEEQFEPIIRIATILHFLAAAAVFLLAFIIL